MSSAGVVNDTLLQGVFEGGTSLGDVYQGLVCGGAKTAIAEFLADQTSDPAAWALPSIQHAEGYEAYQVCFVARWSWFHNILWNQTQYLMESDKQKACKKDEGSACVLYRQAILQTYQ